MALNLSQLSDGANRAVSLSNLILVSPQKTVGYQPQNEPSYKNDTKPLPSALVFNYEGEQSVSIESDITDHYVENNSAIQDQVALRPIQISTQGFVGELNDILPAALEPIKSLAEKLIPIDGFGPQLSLSATLAYVNAFAIYQTAKSVANSAIQTWSTINGIANGNSGDGGQGVINGSSTGVSGANPKTQTEQQIYFQQLFGYWQARKLFTIQTPWAVFQDMAILKLRAVQDSETRMITDFEITFKQMRFAQSLTTLRVKYTDSSNFQGRGQSQAAPENDLGTAPLSESNQTFASFLA